MKPGTYQMHITETRIYRGHQIHITTLVSKGTRFYGYNIPVLNLIVPPSFPYKGSALGAAKRTIESRQPALPTGNYNRAIR